MRADRIPLYWLSALLAACATVPAEDPQPPKLPIISAPTTVPPPPGVEPALPSVPVAVEPPAAVRAIEYFAQVRQRPVRELRSEYDAARRAFAASRSDHDRVRLALLLSLPNAPFSDDARALELLDPITRDAASEYQSLAQLLAALLTEQRRRAGQATALQQKLDRIKALEKEMQQRAATPESRPR